MELTVATISGSRALPAFSTLMTYAIVKLGGKQHRVHEGEWLLVDRLAEDEGATITLTPLLVGGNGDTQLSPEGVVVKAKVVGHVLGTKIRIGKYKPKKGYRRHTGHRSRLSRIEIESIGAPTRTRKKAEEAAAEEQPKATPKPKAEGAEKPKAAKPKAAPAEKPKRTTKKKEES